MKQSTKKVAETVVIKEPCSYGFKIYQKYTDGTVKFILRKNDIVDRRFDSIGRAVTWAVKNLKVTLLRISV